MLTLAPHLVLGPLVTPHHNHRHRTYTCIISHQHHHWNRMVGTDTHMIYTSLEHRLDNDRSNSSNSGCLINECSSRQAHILESCTLTVVPKPCLLKRCCRVLCAHQRSRSRPRKHYHSPESRQSPWLMRQSGTNGDHLPVFTVRPRKVMMVKEQHSDKSKPLSEVQLELPDASRRSGDTVQGRCSVVLDEISRAKTQMRQFMSREPNFNTYALLISFCIYHRCILFDQDEQNKVVSFYLLIFNRHRLKHFNTLRMDQFQQGYASTVATRKSCDCWKSTTHVLSFNSSGPHSAIGYV